jgi:methylmalonyl-CoA/ethylmalonyl-CoA epimerase
MPAESSHIAQIAVIVEDVERATAWYRDRLGLPHLFDAPPGLSFLQCGPTRLMLSRPEEGVPHGNSILYFAVEQMEEAHRSMAEAGVEFLEQPRIVAKVAGRDVWIALCRDSEGNMVGLTSEVEAQPAPAL